ncbi:MAG: AMP-binding protein [Acidimicrobiales bacterium]
MHPGTHAETAPDKPAVVMDDGRTLTYAELEAASNRLAHLFRSQGLTRGDHVALVVENRPELFAVTWAAQRAGLYYTACSTRLTTDELAYIVDDCGARLLVASDTTRAIADAVVAPALESRLTVDGAGHGWTSIADATTGLPSTPIADESEGADMLYSSGTTGRPKGVKPPLPTTPEYPRPPVIAALVGGLLGAVESTVYLSPAPLYHAAPLRYTMSVHRLGGTVVVMEHFAAEAFLRLVQAHRVTFTQVVPTMFIRLLKLPAEVRAAYDTSSLQTVVHAAAPCPVPVKEQMIEWFGPIIHEYYAGTEGNGFVYCTSEQWLAHKGTVGTSLMGPVHILGDDGQELAAGERGTVYFENSGFEYHNDPEKTRGSRDPGGRGWSTLGDVGYLDDDGFLYLTDRLAYVIITGGVNVYPQEAENVLALHPSVDDVAVFGVPNEDFGEEVKAVVQPAAGAEPGPALEAELLSCCRAHLAAVKCPRSVDFRAELPRAPTGKLYKRLLKDEYWR